MNDSDDFNAGKDGAMVTGDRKIRLTKWDVVEHLQSEADVAGYLAACEAENDPALMVVALADVARARALWKG